MARYRYTVTYETDGGSWDAWDDGFEVTSGSDTFGSWDAYANSLVPGDEVQFLNSTTRETDLRSLSGFTVNTDIIASSTYIGYATIRTIASGATSISFTMHVTDHSGAPITTRTFSVTPSVDTIPFGVASGAIDLNNIRNFFGNPTYDSNTIAMSNLYKGGNLVPDITENSSVPTSGTIEMADFYNTSTQLQVDKHPINRFYDIFQGQAGTQTVSWTMSTSATTQGSVDIGYKALKFVLEYRWVITQTGSTGNPPNLALINWGGVDYTSGVTFPYTTPWVTGPSDLSMDFDYGIQTGEITGTAQLQARKVWNGTTYSISTNAALWSVVVENAGE